MRSALFGLNKPTLDELKQALEKLVQERDLEKQKVLDLQKSINCHWDNPTPQRANGWFSGWAATLDILVFKREAAREEVSRLTRKIEKVQALLNQAANKKDAQEPGIANSL